MIEVNFDGLVGPSHNYAGLSVGNVASIANGGRISSPRTAALQGVAKMRRMVSLGFRQGVLLPHVRPDAVWLRRLGFAGNDEAVCRAAWQEAPALLRAATSASAMWTANAATVSPRSDTNDDRTHLTVANLSSMLHRSVEPPQTARQLRLAFGAVSTVVVHDPLPAQFGDEGAANHMRLCAKLGSSATEVFVYGAMGAGGGLPARQSRVSAEALPRRHGVRPERWIAARQSEAAIAAGAFHNDVVAVANEHVLLTHEEAFADRLGLYEALRARVDGLVILEAPASRVSLEDAVASYLFNSQLATLPEGGMLLLIPSEARKVPAVLAWLDEVVASGGPIRQVEFTDLRESMRNGGGPACLRLRIPLDDAQLAAMDQRFLVDQRTCDAIGNLVAEAWPERISPADLGDPALWRCCWSARARLLALLGFEADEL